MEMRHVRVFLALAEELHFGRAAARLRIAQSAVSQTLRALEDEVGAKLFDRTQRRVVLTESGQSFAVSARAALDALSSGAERARRAASGEVGRLSLGFTMMSALTRLPAVVARFQAAHPHADVRVVPGTSAELVASLDRGSCDVAFVSLRAGDAPRFASEVVERTSLVALVPAGHPFASLPSVDFPRIARERLILLSAAGEPSVRGFLKARFEALGVEPDVVLEVQQLEVMMAFVSTGYGVALAPRFAERIGFPGVRAVPLAPSPPSGISAVWLPEQLSATAGRFLDFMRRDGDRVPASSKESSKKPRPRRAPRS